MSSPQRMRAWGAGVAGGHVVLGVIATALHVPGAELFFGLCAVATLVLAFVSAPLLRPRRRRDEGDPPSPPDPPDDDPNPPWWPDFERAFRDYADERAGSRT